MTPQRCWMGRSSVAEGRFAFVIPRGRFRAKNARDFGMRLLSAVMAAPHRGISRKSRRRSTGYAMHAATMMATGGVALGLARVPAGSRALIAARAPPFPSRINPDDRLMSDSKRRNRPLLAPNPADRVLPHGAAADRRHLFCGTIVRAGAFVAPLVARMVASFTRPPWRPAALLSAIWAM
jgi:hypothetical protein